MITNISNSKCWVKYNFAKEMIFPTNMNYEPLNYESINVITALLNFCGSLYEYDFKGTVQYHIMNKIE